MRSTAKKNALIVVAAAAAAIVASHAVAQEPLRWKLNVGDKLEYDTSQNSIVTIKGAPVGDISLTTRQQMDMTWDVTEVNEQGDAAIQQKVERIRVSMKRPTGQSIDYDSNAKEGTAGAAATGTALFEALKKADFRFTLTPRGELKDIKVPDEVVQAFKNSPQAAQLGDQITPEGIQKMLMQDVILLPEKVPTAGDTWTAKSEMSIPSVGNQIVDTTYKIEGTKDVAGKKHAVISAERKIGIAKAENQLLQVEIKDQTADGQALFNTDEGRLSSMTLKQMVVMTASAAGQSIEQSLDQTSEVTVKPAGDDAETAENN